MSTIRISGAMLRFVDYQRAVTVRGDSIRAALDELVAAYPALADVLFDRRNNLRTQHRLALNGEVLSGLFLDYPLDSRDEIDIITAISGG
ncbi:MoaD/ThiS family protein [Nonomuraea insulae]|uniref:MoaD/ThiS family protein n=1 Tax=Nonomuraea insulae TaxID=1616787 RepID=A0ABW1CNF3_9ACTN